MSSDVDVFHFEPGKLNFEDHARSNGFCYWLASELMEFLDYTTMQPILRAVNRAMAACAQLNIPIDENFKEQKTAGGGKDWRLSRFACYLTVMNGDPKKPRVAQAQGYFVTMAESFRQYVQEADAVERIVIRGEVSEREKSLSAAVHLRGIESFPFFQNAGYRGMYNLNLKEIRLRRLLPSDRSPLDFMGKTELAANLFRITQTEEKIRREDITGQRPLESAAEHVGRTVRRTMIDLNGVAPESLPITSDIVAIRRDLKRTGREYAKIDAPRKSGPARSRGVPPQAY
jgi:DNA-damage-inducible protein D